MALPTGQIGYGVTLGIDNTTPGTYVVVANLTNVTFPAQVASDVDVTSINQSTAYKQSIPGLIDGGTITMEAIYTPTGYAALTGLNRAAHGFQIIVPGGPTTYTWEGYVNKVGEMSVEADGVMKFKIEGKVLTAVTVS